MIYTLPADIPYFIETETIVQNLGYRLVSLCIVRHRGGTKITVILHSANGISLGDCEKVHRVLALRFETLLKDRNINFEVTSPGTSRVLKDANEFHAFIDEHVLLWLDGAHDWLKGKLEAVDEQAISLLVDNELQKIYYENIKKAKLY